MAVFEQHTTSAMQYPFVYGAVFNAVCQSVAQLGHRLQYADPNAGTVHFTTGISAFTWGENLVARIAQPDQQQALTIVQLTSSGALPTLIGQGRRNRKIIGAFFDELGRALSSPPYSPGGAWTPMRAEGGAGTLRGNIARP
ncbi:hypothetical protein [uncultured Propionibacterium sp.]|uniref:hypothetical protein n=1 Tax=uncultured Propionibacterium sp. TaxID=218066 RepID=UPI00292D3A76|nr:hypothetical protein [uncultured Propionibacterium sp.]